MERHPSIWMLFYLECRWKDEYKILKGKYSLKSFWGFWRKILKIVKIVMIQCVSSQMIQKVIRYLGL